MKLRNKRTGKIGRLVIAGSSYLITEDNEENRLISEYLYLKYLVEEWEDYEEPKECEYWYIEADGEILQCHKPTFINHLLDKQKEIGNYFETKEEAEKAVEKLKAWKRLKDKGFRFKYNKVIGEYGNVSYTLNYPANAIEEKDLDLLFGGEE